MWTALCTRRARAACNDGDAAWAALGSEPSDTFSWDDASTYVRRARTSTAWSASPPRRSPFEAARALALLGDFITTDTSRRRAPSPPTRPRPATWRSAAWIRPTSTPTARRGNHEVMMRGTFANVKLQNKLAEGKKGGWTRDFATGEVRPLFDASGMDYEAAETPLVVVAGKIMAAARRATGGEGPGASGHPRRVRRELRAVSIGRTSSAWASCRCSSKRARAPRAWDWTVRSCTRWLPSTSRRGCPSRAWWT